jgi:hypothetical protein
MAEMVYSRNFERGKAAGDRLRILDSSLLWLRPTRLASLSPAGWSNLDMELANLHAQYERACIED